MPAWRSRLQHPTLEILERAPSTMDMARERIQQGAVRVDDGFPRPFAGIMAREQTAGRGQRGRVWNSLPDASLCATFYFRHGLDLPTEMGAVALLAGVAVATTLKFWAATASATPDIGLKWPNDVLIDGKKAGGILIETTHTPEGYAVALIGIGLNIGAGAFPPELAANATTLEIAGIAVTDLPTLAAELAEALREQADLFLHGGQPDLVTRWRQWDRTAGRRFHTERDGLPVAGIAEGIGERGQLLLRLPDGALLATDSASTLREDLP